MGSVLRLKYSLLKSKLIKYQSRFEKSLRRGTNIFSTKKSILLRQIEKIKRQLAILNGLLTKSAIAAAVLFSGTIEAQVYPWTEEIKVNTYTTGNQINPNVAIHHDGSFVITWAGYQNEPERHIYAQRYNALGAPIGNEIRVSTTGNALSPQIEMKSNGDFIIVYDAPGASKTDIFMQRFDAYANKIGVETLVMDDPAYYLNVPDLAIHSDDSFVIVWNHDLGIFAQRYDASAAKIGSEFQVNSTTTFLNGQPNIAMDNNANFVVVWNDQDGDDNGVYARIFDASANPSGTEFLVNNYTTGHQWDSDVAMDSDGDFVVVWQSPFDQTNLYNIYAQRYDAQGVEQGNEFIVNGSSSNAYNGIPKVSMDPDGDFLVSWGALTDENEYSIFVKAYDAVGNIVEQDFTVSTNTTSVKFPNSIKRNASGDLVVAWNSIEQDGSGYGVYAKKYAAITLVSPVVGSKSQTYRIYPNPAKDVLNILSESNSEFQIEVFDQMGIEIMKLVQGFSINAQLSLKAIKSGVYLLKINSGETSHSEKILVE